MGNLEFEGVTVRTVFRIQMEMGGGMTWGFVRAMDGMYKTRFGVSDRGVRGTVVLMKRNGSGWLLWKVRWGMQAGVWRLCDMRWEILDAG